MERSTFVHIEERIEESKGRMREPSHIAVSILAAGAARRMGAPKLLASFRGSPLLEHALRAATGSVADATFVIIGAYEQEMRSALQPWPVRCVSDPRWEEGQASSIRATVTHCREQGFAAVLIMVADQPFVSAEHLNALIDAYCSGDATICVSQVGDRRGNPCLFDAECFDTLMNLTGDIGARRLLKEECGFKVLPVSFADRLLFSDVDTEEDLRRLEGDANDVR
jgi:molybdenum cofactor cytidylyltransferase